MQCVNLAIGGLCFQSVFVLALFVFGFDALVSPSCGRCAFLFWLCLLCVCVRACGCFLHSITALGFRAGLCVDSGLWYYGRGSMYPYNPLFSQVPLKFTKVPL